MSRGRVQFVCILGICCFEQYGYGFFWKNSENLKRTGFVLFLFQRFLLGEQQRVYDKVLRLGEMRLFFFRIWDLGGRGRRVGVRCLYIVFLGRVSGYLSVGFIVGIGGGFQDRYLGRSCSRSCRLRRSLLCFGVVYRVVLVFVVYFFYQSLEFVGEVFVYVAVKQRYYGVVGEG